MPNMRMLADLLLKLKQSKTNTVCGGFVVKTVFFMYKLLGHVQ